jgi:hypothetical protein
MSLRSEIVRILNELFGEGKKISELPTASLPLAGPELIEIVQGGQNKKATIDDLPSGGGGSITDGSGTTANGTAVDLGGTLTGNTTFSGSGENITFGSSGSRLGNFRFWSNGTIGLDGSTSAFLQSGSNTISIDSSGIDVSTTGPLSINTDSGTAGQVLESNGNAAAPTWVTIPKVVQLAASDETTALTTGTAKITFRMPYAMTLTEVRASLTVSQYSGSIMTFDINQNGTSVLSTKLTIDNAEETSVTAAIPAVISTSALTDDAEITIDIDQVGDGSAKGLKITLIGI